VEQELRPRRDFNDDRRRIFGGANRLIAFICECADPDCRNTVLLTQDEYDARRPELILHEDHAL
jgi:hypothetical protein